MGNRIWSAVRQVNDDWTANEFGAVCSLTVPALPAGEYQVTTTAIVSTGSPSGLAQKIIKNGVNISNEVWGGPTGVQPTSFPLTATFTHAQTGDAIITVQARTGVTSTARSGSRIDLIRVF